MIRNLANEHSHEETGIHHHSHTHDPIEVGSFCNRPKYSKGGRCETFAERCFTVGIGGPVGSGKSTLVLRLCEALGTKDLDKRGPNVPLLAVVTNDIFTEEDYEFLYHHKALPGNLLAAVQTGGCPHAAIREDISHNLDQVKRLTQQEGAELCIIESGGDNLAANFSRDLADYILYVVDVAGGDKVPRKGGPGVTQSDLLVINKTDLASAVGADLQLMERQGREMRQGGQTFLTNAKQGEGVGEIVAEILRAREAALAVTN